MSTNQTTSTHLLTAFLVACLTLLSCSASKILLVPTIGKSHIFAISGLGRELVRRGHEVHVLLQEEFKASTSLLTPRAITISNSTTPAIKAIRYGAADPSTIVDADVVLSSLTEKMIATQGNIFSLLPVMMNMSNAECRRLLLDNEPVMQRLAEEKYDIAIVDGIFMMRWLYLIPLRLGIPWITYTDFAEPWLVRVPWLPSFVSLPVSLYTERMSFTERLLNTIITIAFYMIPDMTDAEVLAKYQRYGQFDSANQLVAKSVFWITSRENVLDYPKPSMPNIIDAAGLTIEPSSGSKLPNDINSFISTAEMGVILVTFGSMVSNLPAEMVEKFFTAFRQLEAYHVIMRLDNKDNVPVPNNVRLWSWLPQNDILALVSTKLFITHCGNNGQVEAVYHGVPMIGFPLGGDQPYNGLRIQYHGYGIAMKIHDFTADQLLDNIKTILRDNSYKSRVMKASQIFKSSPMTPGQRAAYWVEHVIKYGGAHLHSAGNDLPMYQYMMLDILAVVCVIMVIIAACICKTTRFCVRKICRASVEKAKHD